MNASLNTTEELAAPRGPMKFIYASGSRPLPGYTIKRGVGRGGFGEVYYAVSDAGKEVALKLIRRHLDVELRGITHCLNLKHPNLLALYDVKQDDEDNTWVIMEYLAGQSLEDLLEQHPHGLPPQEACGWMRGIAAGVAYLHNHGIVHRDLKPGNVFREEGLIKLGDYGLSKFISCSRRSGQTDSVGTVHYMAPEVANGRYGKQIDIYALGIILFEMLTGRVPFEGESIGEVLMKHLTALPDLSPLAEPYRSIVGRALAKDPDQRFSSVEEMAAQLPAALGADAASYMNLSGPSPAPSAAAASRAATAPPPASGLQPPASPAPGGAGPALAAATQAVVDDEEPIWRAVSDQWRRAVAWWNSPNLNASAKAILTLFAIYAALSKSAILFESAVVLMLCYAVYRVVRAIVLGLGAPPARQAPAVQTAPAEVAKPQTTVQAPAAGPAPVAQAAYSRRNWREKAAPALIVKSPRVRLTELLGSLLMAAGVTVVISILVLLFRGQSPQPEQYAWLALVSTLGAWSVLISAKFWEGTRVDPSLRRFVLLVIGLALGAAAYGCDRLLIVDLPFDNSFVNPSVFKGSGLGRSLYSMYSSDGSPLLSAFLVYFGLLFLVVRWWRQADPLRSSRLSLGATVSTICVAWLINFFWPFPQPWGLMAAATISLAVQLASPWAGEQRGRKN
jgi:hypothetical protein